MDPDVFKIVFFGLLFVVAPTSIVLATGLSKALAHRISGEPEPDPELRAALDETLERLEQTEQQLADTLSRLTEVEERLDFAERLLTQRSGAGPALPGGGH